MQSTTLRMVLLTFFAAATSPLCAAPEEMKISEIAPGVYFRKAQTSPVFTGCNQGWVVFRDYVLIIDANFPGQADEVIASIRKTTEKPIRYVFDTHYHGDHADGNMQYAKIGATIIAQERSQALFQTKGKEGFARSQVDRAKEYGQLTYELPSMYFSHKLVLDDGEQRVELLFFGHGHTAGDAVAWLPKHNILFTGDACVNGAFNYTGDSSTESWVAALGGMQELSPKMVCPGHGESGGLEVLANQRRYLSELRTTVGSMIATGKGLDTIKKEISIPFFKEWTGVDVTTRGENIEHVFKEFTAGKKPATDSTSFRRWERMPGKEGYENFVEWEALDQAPADIRFDALAKLYVQNDSAGRRAIRDYFSGKTSELSAMGTYVRRAAVRLWLSGESEHLTCGLAIAAIESGRDDDSTSIDSLLLLRYAADKKAIDASPFFSQIRDLVAPEQLPMFESARNQPQDKLAQVATRLGPKEWR